MIISADKYRHTMYLAVYITYHGVHTLNNIVPDICICQNLIYLGVQFSVYLPNNIALYACIQKEPLISLYVHPMANSKTTTYYWTFSCCRDKCTSVHNIPHNIPKGTHIKPHNPTCKQEFEHHLQFLCFFTGQNLHHKMRPCGISQSVYLH